MKRFGGGLEFKAHRLVHHSTPGWRVIKKKKKELGIDLMIDSWLSLSHPGVELRANLKSISHRCYLREVVFESDLTKETIHLPLSCLQGCLQG